VRQQILDALALVPGVIATLVRNLIADYEAVLTDLRYRKLEIIAALDERDQLRREVERLQAQIDRPTTTTTHRDVYAADERRTSP
jgi:hypothetical protein